MIQFLITQVAKLKSAVAVANAKVKTIGNVAASSSSTFSIENNSRAVVFTIGGGLSQGMWIVNCQSTGPVNIFEVNSNTAVSMASSDNNKFTITNSGSTVPTVCALEFVGSVS